MAGLYWGLDGMWVFFAPGALKAAVTGIALVLTLGAALLDWTPPAVDRRWIGVGLGALAVTACWVLQGFANSADEYAYVFQAQTYLSGRLWNPAPPLGQGLAADYTWVKDGLWAGQYPPGWPSILALFGWTGWPLWAVNGVLAAALLGLVRWVGGPRFGLVPVLAMTPFFIFTGASMHSHMAAALLGLAALACLELALAQGSLIWALLAGVAVGWLGLIRYISAALMALPFALSLLAHRRWRMVAAVALGMVPGVVLLLCYHQAITGNPLVPVYWLSGRQADHLYFDAQGIGDGVRISLWRWVELVQWAGPGLVCLWLGVLARKGREGGWRALDWVFPLFVLTFLFYPFDGANRYGPRYYFEAFPFLVLAARRVDLGPAARRLMALNVAYCAVVLPFLGLFYHDMVTQRLDLYTQVRRMGLSNAVVLVKDGPGRIWRMEPDDLARNGLNADGPVLYARPDLVNTAQLHGAFPDRTIWVYACTPDCAITPD